MSATVAATRDRVYYLIGDRNPDRRSIGSLRMNRILEAEVGHVAARALLPREAAETVSLSAGTYDYNLTGTMQRVVQVFLNSIGLELAYVPFDIFNSRYLQETQEPAASATPNEYTLWEGPNNVTRIRVGPTPNATDSLKVHKSILPTSFGTAAPDAVSIPFSDELLRALELYAASSAVAMLSDDELQILKVNRGVAPLWRSEADDIIRRYNARVRGLGSGQDRVIRTSQRLTSSRWR